MKYQSEIIKDIIENNGHHVTTNPHYEVDCINEIINDVRGSYPKLCDYMGEWMNYANEHMNIGKFPIERVTDVTNARFENVVPYEYKSAILKGQTVSNLWKELSNVIVVQEQQEGTTIQYDYSEQYAKVTFGEKQVNAATTVGMNTTQLQGNKTYYINTFVLDGSETTDTFLIRDGFNNVNLQTTLIKEYPTGQILSFTTEAPTSRLLFYYFAYTRKYGGVNYGKPYYMPKRFIVSDKLEDVVNQDFFEGMQSVKMPVLTTTGKNLFDYKNYGKQDINIVEIENGLRVSTWATSLPFINNLLPNTKYTSKSVVKVVEEQVGATDIGAGKIYISNGTNYFLLFKADGGEYVFTTPSDIKSYNRILFYAHGGGGSKVGVVDITNIQIELGSTSTPYDPYKSNILTVNEDVDLRGVGDVRDELDLLTGKLTQRIDEDGEVLSQEVVKTVDLSCLDENNNPTKFKPYEGVMNVVTSSETLPPLLDMEVPVEAITQNLMSFIK